MKSLKSWFILHFVIDMIFAIPLLIIPIWTLNLFGIHSTETIMPRLVGAALVGIGGTSYLTRNATKESYKTLLKLKLLWSGTATLGLLLAIYQGAPKITWLFVSIFSGFYLVWSYYNKRI